ncbi:MAG: hypothetical protein M3Y55_05730 [Pseudomonadota bacterium]|nr:hypothetical protein [Pseudomonadota bacterium]
MISPRTASPSIRLLLASAVLVTAQAASPTSLQPAPVPSASVSVSSADGEERALIAQDRAAAEARFSSRERECRQRFVVTSCLDAAKADRRKTLDQLRARQLVVDEARRRERAQERKRELAEKAAEDSRRGSVLAVHGTASAASAASLSDKQVGPRQAAFAKDEAKRNSSGRSPAHAPSAAIGLKPRPPESKAVREQREASHRAAFEARQAEAARHREETIERTTRRLAQKPPAAPLPVPGASAAAGVPRAASHP